MITLTTIFDARKNRGTKLYKLHKPYNATMEKYYFKIINTKYQLRKFVSTNLFDLDKNVLKDNYTIP